jgi:hypothetical protein
MNNGLDLFAEDLTENQRHILYFLHDEFIAIPNIECKIKFNVPFFYHHSWVCYITSKKKKKLELCFINGQELTDVYGILEKRNRKMVSGIMLSRLEDIPIQAIMELFQEAIILDQNKFKSKKKQKR